MFTLYQVPNQLPANGALFSGPMRSRGFGGGMSFGALASPPGAASPSFGAPPAPGGPPPPTWQQQGPQPPPPPMSFGAAAPQSLFGAPQSQSCKAAAPQSRGLFGTSLQSCAAPRSESFRGFGSSSERTRGRGQKKGFSSQSTEITFDGDSDTESGENYNVQVRFINSSFES